MNLIVGDSSKLGQCISAYVYLKRKEKLVQSHVSENADLFWVKSQLLEGMNFWIMKDSEEGKRLQKLLENKEVSAEEIVEFIDLVAIKNMTHEDLFKEIKNVKTKTFENGQEDIKTKFRKLIAL